MTNWKDKLTEMDSTLDLGIDDILSSRQESQMNDVGLVNKHSGAGILVRESGRIEAFADHGLGFVIDPDTQSMMLFAPNLKIFNQKKETMSFNNRADFLQKEYKDVSEILNKGG